MLVIPLIIRVVINLQIIPKTVSLLYKIKLNLEPLINLGNSDIYLSL